MCGWKSNRSTHPSARNPSRTSGSSTILFIDDDDQRRTRGTRRKQRTTSLRVLRFLRRSSLIRPPERLNRVEERIAEVGGFLRADAIDFVEILDTLRPTLHHVAQRRV